MFIADSESSTEKEYLTPVKHGNSNEVIILDDSDEVRLLRPDFLKLFIFIVRNL